MNKPLIGVTSYHRNEADRFTLPANYLQAVERAGGLPIIIAPTETNIEDQIGSIDGVMLTGGADIDPVEYGGESKSTIYGINRERDRYELQLTRLALEKKLPTLAICRGLQIMNVAMGGTLVEHLPDEYGETVTHRGDNMNKVEHSVSIAEHSMLATILELTEISCSSYHHQSVRRLASGFKVVASSEDGVIEAIESAEYPHVIAVQWHPEHTAEFDPIQQRLFNIFVAWASGETNILPQFQPVEAMVQA